MHASSWHEQLSSTATNRQRQFDELTNVTFTLKNSKTIKLPENPNLNAEYHVFAEVVKLSLEDALKKHVVEVTFKTLSGETRTMVCTQPDTVVSKSTKPQDPKAATLGGQGNPTKVLKVFAIDRNDWRSIRTDSVLSWKIKSSL